MDMEFIVTNKPPWYLNVIQDDAFSCESEEGLLETVAMLMMSKQQELSSRESKYRAKTQLKIIRDMVIQNAESIKQKPSRLLLHALMDIIDIQVGHGFTTSETCEDKAGMKHVLLAHTNYTEYYVPEKVFYTLNGTRTIPVVSHYSKQDNFVFCDGTRSMIGTYTVYLPDPVKDNEPSYFVQEALFVPGPSSLHLLEKIVGERYAFWDMALEVPTHKSALTPCFREIQCTRTPGTEMSTLFPSNNGSFSDMENIQPMCCVIGPESAGDSETNGDYLTEGQVGCNLSNFQYHDGHTRTIYLRKGATSRDGKCNYLVPVVVLRKTQQERYHTLYISTTLQFLRALQHSSVKGTGEPVTGWKETLIQVNMESFLTGTKLCQELVHCAFTAYIKRVNPNSFGIYLPNDFERVIVDPVRVEVVEFALKLMDSNIPNAFAVAELLNCSINTVEKYVRFWNRFRSNNNVSIQAKKQHRDTINKEMKNTWKVLAETMWKISELVPETNIETVKDTHRETFGKYPLDITSASKFLTTIQNIISKTKKSNTLICDCKVLLKKLRIYDTKLKKTLKTGECNDIQCEPAMSNSHSIVIPESIPICVWINNLSTLLLSHFWLYNDNIKREAVCTLLEVDTTLLAEKNYDMVLNWVNNNQMTMNQLKSHQLSDTLSKALLNCLNSNSVESWKCKVMSHFQHSQVNVKKDNKKTKVKPEKPSSRSTRKSKHSSKQVGRQTLKSRKSVKSFFSSQAYEEGCGDHSGYDDFDYGSEKDAYDLTDPFINDGSITEPSSSSDALATIKNSKRKQSKTKKMKRKRILNNDSSEDEFSVLVKPKREPLRYKRVLSSDTQEDCETEHTPKKNLISDFRNQKLPSSQGNLVDLKNLREDVTKPSTNKACGSANPAQDLQEIQQQALSSENGKGIFLKLKRIVQNSKHQTPDKVDHLDEDSVNTVSKLRPTDLTYGPEQDPNQRPCVDLWKSTYQVYM